MNTDNCRWCGRPLPAGRSRRFKYHDGECQKAGHAAAHLRSVQNYYHRPPMIKERRRDPARMMKILRDDFARMKMVGQIRIPKGTRYIQISGV